MKPNECEWTAKAWELIARHEILIQLRKDGKFDRDAWLNLIDDLDEHKMFALANDLRRDMQKENK